MKLSQSYVEMLNSGMNRPAEEGERAYPIAAMEMLLMEQARHNAHMKEAALFRRFSTAFDWQLSRQQQNGYVRKLKEGNTLVLTDSSRKILWASQNFLRMTGHRVIDVLGQKPSLLQGPATNTEVINQIRNKLNQAKPVRADLLNYRKDGSTYICEVAIDPIFDTLGKVTHFLAVEREAAAITAYPSVE